VPSRGPATLTARGPGTSGIMPHGRAAASPFPRRACRSCSRYRRAANRANGTRSMSLKSAASAIDRTLRIRAPGERADQRGIQAGGGVTRQESGGSATIQARRLGCRGGPMHRERLRYETPPHRHRPLPCRPIVRHQPLQDLRLGFRLSRTSTWTSAAGENLSALAADGAGNHALSSSAESSTRAKGRYAGQATKFVRDSAAWRSMIGWLPQELTTEPSGRCGTPCPHPRLSASPKNPGPRESLRTSLWDKKDSKVMTLWAHEAPSSDRQGALARAGVSSRRADRGCDVNLRQTCGSCARLQVAGVTSPDEHYIDEAGADADRSGSSARARSPWSRRSQLDAKLGRSS